MLTLTEGVNVYFAPLAVLALMIRVYLRDSDTDRALRRTFVVAAACVAGGALSDLVYSVLSGSSMAYANGIILTALTLLFSFQLAASLASVLMLDYITTGDLVRGRRLAIGLGAIFAAHTVLLLVNLRSGSWFEVSAANEYVKGPAYPVRLVFAYAPALIAGVNLLLSRKRTTGHQIWLMVVFVISVGLGGLYDMNVAGGKLIWPSFAVSLLFLYLFIVRSDALQDSLTGVRNRRACKEYLDRLARRGWRQPHAFILIDVDGLKQINDDLGHAAGDLALVDTARILRESVRSTDFLARYGGDEFLLVSRVKDDPEAILARIGEAVDAQNDAGERPYTLSLSIGFDVLAPRSPIDPHEFVNHVDRLMYLNKHDRRASTGPQPVVPAAQPPQPQPQPTEQTARPQPADTTGT